MKVKRIKVSRYNSAQFAKLSHFLLGKNNERWKVYASIRYKLHLAKGLRANILISNNLLASESFVFHLGLGYAIVDSCGVNITIRARQRGQFLRRRLLVKKNGVVLPYSKAMIPLLPMSTLDDRDFLFHLTA